MSQPTESPTEVVRATLTEVFRILEDPKLKDPAKLMPRRRMLEQVIGERFDYAEMSKRALAANWTPLTNDQRAEFVELFKAFLSDRYAGKIEGYSGDGPSIWASGSKDPMRKSVPGWSPAKSKSQWITG